MATEQGRTTEALADAREALSTAHHDSQSVQPSNPEACGSFPTPTQRRAKFRAFPLPEIGDSSSQSFQANRTSPRVTSYQQPVVSDVTNTAQGQRTASESVSSVSEQSAATSTMAESTIRAGEGSSQGLFGTFSRYLASVTSRCPLLMS